MMDGTEGCQRRQQQSAIIYRRAGGGCTLREAREHRLLDLLEMFGEQVGVQYRVLCDVEVFMPESSLA
jgi:hypothetical protein